MTASLTEDRERHSRLASDLEREAELLRQGRRWVLAPRRRRKERADTAELTDRAQEHRRRVAQAHEQLRSSPRSAWTCILARNLAAALGLVKPRF